MNVAPADPYGLAGKSTRQLDQLIAAVKPAGTTYYELAPEDRAYFDALVKARDRRFGKQREARQVPDIDKAFQGAYANPGKDPDPKPPREPPRPGSDLDVGDRP